MNMKLWTVLGRRPRPQVGSRPAPGRNRQTRSRLFGRKWCPPGRFRKPFCGPNQLKPMQKTMPKSMSRKYWKMMPQWVTIMEKWIPNVWNIIENSKQFRNLRILVFCKVSPVKVSLSLNGRSNKSSTIDPQTMQNRCTKKQGPTDAKNNKNDAKHL